MNATPPLLPPLIAVPRDRPLPLSAGQVRFWETIRELGDVPALHTPYAVEITGPLDLDFLRNSLDGVIARHEILRTQLREVDGAPAQIVGPPWHVELNVELAIDVEEALDKAKAMLLEPFDVARDRLLRFPLFSLWTAKGAEARHLLVIIAHHAVMDGGSWPLFFNEVAELYSSQLTGHPPNLPTLPLQYADFAAWQRGLPQAVADEHLDFWRGYLDGSPERIALHEDKTREVPRSFLGSEREVSVSPELWAGIERQSRAMRCTPFMLTLAAFGVVVRSLADGQDDLVLGVPLTLRNRVELRTMMGYFLAHAAVRLDLSGDPTFADLVARVRNTCLDVLGHVVLPIREALGMGPDRFYQVRFNFVPPWPSYELPGGVTMVRRSLSHGRLMFDLAVYLEAGRRLTVRYKTDVFFDKTIEALMARYLEVLQTIVATPDLPLSAL